MSSDNLPPENPNDSAIPNSAESNNERRPFLIGSQRDPMAYKARKQRDWTPIEEPAEAKSSENPPAVEAKDAPRQPLLPESVLNEMMEEPTPLPTLPEELMPPASGHFPPPNIRDQLTPDLEAEFEQALGDASLDDLMAGGSAPTDEVQLEPDTKLAAKIIAIRKDDVFVELGSREQGILPLHIFTAPPAIGGTLQVIVQKLNREDGLYELSLPGMAAHVEDWSDLREGTLVDARVTAHNPGGLECTVNNIRGFIPFSQVALFRVETLEEFVGQTFACIVTEANPDRRNLVLSRRAVLERERAETREKLLAALAPGQIHEGVVRKLMDFGAFVDLGGVEGLLHVSQLAWGRVKHPSEVLSEGQRLKVRVDKVDPATGKISLAYRDLMESPWSTAPGKYPQGSINRGTVTKLMDFGAFVELEPGVEGLVHISELSHKRVFRTSDVVKEGDQVEVMVQSIDPEAKRIGLSMKALQQPEPTKKELEAKAEADALAESHAAASPDAPPAEPPKPKKPAKEMPLTGGLGKRTGEKFGLKW
ncbi:MAG: S1 RNA-binding domain-containing protein [Pirellulales bacterium]|nr:S1 RNA-binding domain-containing protein [Pirellulales bacterium]